MTIAYWMVLAAAILPYVCVAIAKWRRGYDNHAPRAGIEQLDAMRQRAYWAHLNAFEAFPPFAAAVIIAHLAQASQPAVNGLAIAFVIARGLHLYFYLKDMATARSLAWTAGFGCVIALFVIST